ncbi:MAG: SusC/RagA family TonB-linked outer membrane protein [Muribaculaceae bacterium]
MKKLFLLLLTVCSLTMTLSAQMRTVKGQVVYAGDNEPLVGATILPVGGGQGVATNFDGEFTLTVPEKVKLLTVSYVGMITKQVTVAPTMVIKMSNSDHQLDEVVVTALGMKKDRKALGYSVQDLKAEDMNTDGTTSLASAIQGKLTGVDIRPSSGAPGASANIVIRGARSFDGNNAPLYVVDGMPIASEADYSTGKSVTGANLADRSIDINPEDIESINVLKGQAASALYGMRASNGVILITTKRGSGIKTNKPVVTLSANFSAERVSRKFDRQNIYSQGNGVGAYDPTSSMNWGPKIENLPNDAKFGGNGKGHDGKYFNPKRELAGLDGWSTPQIYDNVGDFFNTGFTENANFGITQKLDKCSYSFGLNNSHQEGIIPSTGMDRWGARGLVDWQINDQWKTGFSINYTSTQITSAPGANNGIMNVVYSAPSEYNLKGTPYNVPGEPTQQVLFRSTSFNNPYWWAKNDKYSQHTNRAYGNAYVEYRPKINWGENFDLYFKEQAGVDMYTSDYSDIAEVGSAINKNGQILNYGVSKNIFNNLFTANFSAKLGAEQEWDLGVMLGSEVNQESSRNWEYYGSNFNFYGLPTIGNATNLTSSEYLRKKRTVGFFGSASLSWKNQLYLTVTGRNDYVSTMPRNNRSFLYPSVSLGWIFTELPQFKNNQILTFGKLRASFAQVGQAGNYYDNYYYTPAYGAGMYIYGPLSYPLGGVSTFVPYFILFDANLKPQNTTNYEVGTDLRFFGDRLRVDYTFSYQDVKDQIFDVPTDGTTGYQYMRTNAGRMETYSHELGISGAILQGKDYSLDLGVNFTRVWNFVKELAPGVESIMLGGFAEPQVRAQAHETYPIIYGTAFQRDKSGKLLLKDGLPQGTGDSQKIGQCTPDFNMGINLSGRYKRVSVSTTWSWQQGGEMYHGTNMTLNFFGATKESLDYHEGKMVVDGVDAVTGKQNEVEVSKQKYYQAYYDVTESGIYDTSFLKLRDVTLTYNLPKIGLFDISVFGFARNILIWANLPNFDPESSQGNNNMGGYFERFSVPNTSSYGAGFKVTF